MKAFEPRRRRRGSRQTHRGAAMMEFIMMLPFILFIAALSIYMANGLYTKEETQITVRHRVWREVRRSWWHDDHHSWSNWNGDANGPIGSGAVSGERPRGEGEEIEYLYDNAGRDARAAGSDSQADDYFRRVWNNLPGRHHRHRVIDYQTGAPVYKFLDGPVRTDYYNDSPTWTHGQEPPWLIAMYGPMREIKEAFDSHLADVPEEFRRMREEVLHAWFKEEDLLNWNNPSAVQP